MSTALWIGAGFLGALAAERIFSAPSTGGIVMTKQAIEKTILVMGRATYLHAPAGASRIVVFFHGFGGIASSRGPALAKALGDQPVALVVPQLGSKSEPGDLATAFPAYLESVRRALGLSSGPVDAAAHSGGYKAMALAYNQTPFRALGLLDALYGSYETYLAAAKSGHCLIDIYGPTTTTLSKQLRDAVGSRANVKIFPTTFAHDTIPETYFGAMVRAFDGCQSMSVA